jgi:hypothetical protein
LDNPGGHSLVERSIDAAQKALELAQLQLRAEVTRFVQSFVSKDQETVAQAEIQRTALELAATLKLNRALPRILTTNATGGFVLEGLPTCSYVVKAFRSGSEPSRLTIVDVKSGQDAKADVTIRPF